jgi:CHAD domain-containing protein
VTPRRAAPVELDPDATTSSAFLAVTAECIEHWRANVDWVLSERAPESLHQTRVGLRRFRTALSLFGPKLDDPQLPWLKAEIRTLALPLGVARDLDVFLASDWVDDLDHTQVATLRARRDTAYDALTEVLTSGRWADAWALVERFRARAPWGLDPDPPAVRSAGKALDRRWRRVTRPGLDLRALSPIDRHRVRIEGKKLRYGAQFFDGLFPEPSGTPPLEFAAGLGELQDTLGLLNDAHTDAQLLASLGVTPPDHDEAALLDAAVAAHEDVRALRPFWRKPWNAETPASP